VDPSANFLNVGGGANEGTGQKTFELLNNDPYQELFWSISLLSCVVT
jgi:succinyl-CoA synthetase beta subunit